MLRLILMRHAKSAWGGVDIPDHERPLNGRGRASAAALGDWIRQNGYTPEQVLCSSAQRTGETLFGLKLAPKPVTLFSKALYLSEAQTMLETLHSATAQNVLVLGHNHGVCEMAHRLLFEPPEHHRFSDYPTGATLVCDFDLRSWAEVKWHTGKVVDFVIPRELLHTT